LRSDHHLGRFSALRCSLLHVTQLPCFSLQNYFVFFMHWLFETEIPWSLAKGWQHLLARSVFLMLLDMSIILRHVEIFCWGCRKLNLKTSTRAMEHRQTSAGLCYWPKILVALNNFYTLQHYRFLKVTIGMLTNPWWFSNWLLKITDYI